MFFSHYFTLIEDVFYFHIILLIKKHMILGVFCFFIESFYVLVPKMIVVVFYLVLMVCINSQLRIQDF